jgi:hypothetical protein
MIGKNYKTKKEFEKLKIISFCYYSIFFPRFIIKKLLNKDTGIGIS